MKLLRYIGCLVALIWAEITGNRENSYKYSVQFFNKIWCTLYRVISRGSGSAMVMMFHDLTTEATNFAKYRINVNEFEEKLVENIQTKIPSSIADYRENSHDDKDRIYITLDDGHKAVYDLAYPVLKKHNVPFTLFITINYLDTPRYITTAELLEMAADPLCTIGAHTYSHPSCRRIENSAEEIQGSKQRLEEILGREVEYFAFPYGGGDNVSMKNILEARSAGYLAIFSTLSFVAWGLARRIWSFVPRIEGVHAWGSRK